MNSKITVDIWSDLICPWCWIGRRRFESALVKSGFQDQFEINHRAFRLGPGEVVGPVEEMLGQRYQKSKEDVLKMFEHVESTAAADGLEYHLAGTLFGDTLDAHRLVLWSKAQGIQHEVLERLSKAYFTEKETIFDTSNLVRLAAEAGANSNDVKLLLESTDLADQVANDEEQARRMGASGVPFFVFANKFAVPGAQPIKIFEQVIADLTQTK